MTRLLLDTTFLIGAERAGSSMDELIADDDDVAIAAVTLAELRVGALLGRGRRGAQRASYVDDIARSVRIAPYDQAVAENHALLLAHVRRAGSPRGAHDLLIAATARTTRRKVLTAAESAFDGLPGVEVLRHRDNF